MSDQKKTEDQTISDADLDGVSGGLQAPTSGLSQRGFNPQPEPPAKTTSTLINTDHVSFNPQPEPPAKSTVVKSTTTKR